jgi:hypothetical protein
VFAAETLRALRDFAQSYRRKEKSEISPLMDVRNLFLFCASAAKNIREIS